MTMYAHDDRRSARANGNGSGNGNRPAPRATRAAATERPCLAVLVPLSWEEAVNRESDSRVIQALVPHDGEHRVRGVGCGRRALVVSFRNAADRDSARAALLGLEIRGLEVHDVLAGA
jgi:hypothetical protein